MPSVPCQKWFSLQKAAGRSCILIDRRNPFWVFRFAINIFQAESSIVLTRRTTLSTTHFPVPCSIHLLARCNRSSGPSARTTGRYL
jgi:hypothetical protein